MKKIIYVCDVCSHESPEGNVFDAELKVGNLATHKFHVCTTCYGETPKGCFQKAFNALIRKLTGR